jgi:putative peptidoglycan lipid II flippase
MVVTYRYGISTDTDIYNALYLIVTTLAQLIAGGLEFAVIPVFLRVRMQGEAQASALFSTLLSILIIVLIVSSLALYIFQRQIITVAAPGLVRSQDVMALAVEMLPYVIPVLSLITVITFFESALNARGQFGWPAYAGVLVPISTATVVLAWRHLPCNPLSHDILILCIGNVIGLMLHLTAVIIRAYKAGIRYKMRLNLNDKGVRSVVRLSRAPMCAALVGSLGPLVDQQIASIIGDGTITALGYANRIFNMFIFVIFASLGQAAFPALARQAIGNNTAVFKNTLRLCVWIVGFVAVFLSFGLIFFAQPIVQILFERGRFSSDATQHVRWLLIGLAIGLPAAAVLNLVGRALSALQQTRVLMVKATIFVIFNALLDISLAPVWGGFGIALATSLAYTIDMLLIVAALRMAIGPLSLFEVPPELLSFLSKIRAALINTAPALWSIKLRA